jgi:catechol 2,3-dioxygenase-like lactoylglutathione lyase family enzyme
MRNRFLLACLVTCLATIVTIVTAPAQVVSTGASPQDAWLLEWAGDWDTRIELFTEPGKPPLVGTGRQRVSTVGKSWIVADGESEVAGATIHRILTIGFDDQKGCYVATAIHSRTNELLAFEGRRDERGSTLVLEARGRSPYSSRPKITHREILEVKDENHRVRTSQYEGAEGEWVTLAIAHHHRRTASRMRIELTSVMVDDQAKAQRFYTEILGFETAKDLPLGGARWLTVRSRDGHPDVELLLEPLGFEPARVFQKALFDAGIPAASFAVKDVAKEHARLLELDVEFKTGPTDVGTTTIAVFADTCGNWIQIHQA